METVRRSRCSLELLDDLVELAAGPGVLAVEHDELRGGRLAGCCLLRGAAFVTEVAFFAGAVVVAGGWPGSSSRGSCVARGLLRRGPSSPGAFVAGGLLGRGLLAPGAFLAGAFLAGAFLAGAFVGGRPSSPEPSWRAAFFAGAFFGGSLLRRSLLRPARPSWRAPSSPEPSAAAARRSLLRGRLLRRGGLLGGAAFFAADFRPITRFAAAAAEPARDLRVVPAMSEGLRKLWVWLEPHGRREGIRCHGAGQPRLAEMRERPP